MKFFTSWWGKITVTVVAVCAGLMIGRWMDSGSDSMASPAFSSQKPASKQSFSLDSLEREATSPAEAPVKERGLRREALLLEGEQLAARWPDSAAEAQRRARELAAQDPVAGLTLLSPLHERSLEGVTTWEREIIRNWSQQDQAAMQTTMSSLFEPGKMAPEREHWLSIAASVTQNENRAGLNNMLEWLAKAESQHGGSLTIMGINKLLTHYDPQSFQAMGKFLLARVDNPIHREDLMHMSNLQAKQKPAEALAWVSLLPDLELRTEALEAVVAGAVMKEPDLVADWINNGQLFSTSGLSATLTADEQQRLRDRVLRTYFDALIAADPEYVAKYADTITDQKSRDYLKKMALIVAQNALLPEGEKIAEAPVESKEETEKSPP